MMWSWKDKITRKELLEHLYQLPRVPAAELKEELKKRGQPVSGRQRDLWMRLLFYDIANMSIEGIIPPEIWKKFYDNANKSLKNSEEMTKLYYELQEVLETLLLDQWFVLNWTDFPEVLLK